MSGAYIRVKNNIVTLQSGCDIDYRLGIVGHINTYFGQEAIKQTTLPVVYC